MRRLARLKTVSVISLLAVCFASAASAQLTYTITDLGSLPGGAGIGTAINASGQVTGYGDSAGTQAFLYSNGTITELGTLPGGGLSFGYGINDSGQVVGESNGTSFLGHAFLYSGGTMTDLGTLPGGSASSGQGINASGQIAGLSSGGSFHQHAFLYSSGTMTDLGTFPGGSFSTGLGINDAGWVTGSSDGNGISSGNAHAFLYDGTMHDLGTLPGGTFSEGQSINASGQIAGVGDGPGFIGTSHALLYSGGVMHDLGTLPGGAASFGITINASGQVVGDSSGTNFSDHAFLYSGGTMTDLNTVLPPNSGWTILIANGINDAGQITGVGTPPGGPGTSAFILTPPAISALISIVESENLPEEIQTVLTDTLTAAENAHNKAVSCFDLTSFSLEVDLLHAFHELTPTEASQLTADTNLIKLAQGCR
ncbi:MAG: hypothetical protein ABSD96_20070 [Candidatus Korobacteraceae bacterium]|jgi:probable HAF family extracellular repeat protein